MDCELVPAAQSAITNQTPLATSSPPVALSTNQYLLTMGNKSAAKIRRNQARAAARGETYDYAPPAKPTDEPTNNDEDQTTKAAAAEKLVQTLAEIEKNAGNLNSKDRRTAKRKAEAIASEEAGCTSEELIEWHAKQSKKLKHAKSRASDAPTKQSLSKEEEAKLVSAKRLKEALDTLESDEAMNSKERRSAKRKAEAIACEETGVDASELLSWYKEHNPTKDDTKKRSTPYILFVGQLAFSTTSDMLFKHFQTTLGKEINEDTMKIRLLSDSKTNKSKGMAFIELSTPEIMYECLKMHLTHLDGRRINVERSSGGGAAAKKSRISSYREKQSHFISETMDKIIAHHIDNGDIGQDELDEGVIALCKRHSAVVVEQALKEYVEEKRVRKERKEELGEKEEENLRNPSAFLTHMIGRVAEEGMDSGKSGKGGGKGRSADGSGYNRRKGHDKEHTNESKSESILEKTGVDMSISHMGNHKISNNFPSMQRGRGRGRGRGHM
jgi:RNA recognition motif-containing protein